MVARRLVALLRLRLLSQPSVHIPAGRPLAAPILPPLNLLRHPRKVIRINPIRQKARCPIINRHLHPFFNSHIADPFYTCVWIFCRGVGLPRPLSPRKNPSCRGEIKGGGRGKPTPLQLAE